MSINNTSRKERICSVTDGVYAIVITILVFNLKPPETPGLTEIQLLDSLVNQGRSFITYIISFFLVAVFWFRHHEVFKAVARCNNFFIGINFFHMLCLTLIPYTASLAARYEEDQLAVLLFLINLWLSGLSIALLSQYVVKKPEWHEKESAEQLIDQHWLYRYSVTVAVIPVIIVSFFSHDIALYMCFGFPVITSLVIRRL
jgi:uncharacterized membrane protein